MKLIDVLIRLYPEEFRARFGAAMRAFHRDRAREDRPVTARVIADHVASAAREQLRALRPDVRYALRRMRQRPGFAAVVVCSVALGVGANAAIYSVAQGVLLRPLPYPGAERVVTLGHVPPYWLVSEPQYAEYRTHLRALESIAAFTRGEINLLVGTEPERVARATVSREFFATLGVAPLLGRTFAEGEDAIRPATTVVISHDLWARRFASDPAVIGRTVRLNTGITATVIGVMPAGFEYPSRETALWLPACSQRTCTSLSSIQPDTLDGWANHYLSVIARLREGVSIDRARAEAAMIARRIVREHPENFNPATPLAPVIETIQDSMVGATRPYILALLGAVGVLLLIVCVNVANLLLARGEVRRREMALRTAIGASRRRLLTQLLTESILLAMTGGVLGLALAWAGTRALVAAAPASVPRLEEIGVDWSVAIFALAISVGAGVVFGILPALRGSDEAPADVLKFAGKGSPHIGTSRRARRVLVVAELAVAMVLLSGAGLLVRSLVNLQGADLGFEPAGALTLRVSPSGPQYTDARTALFYTQLLERVRAIPGVRSAGAARWLPVVDAGGLWDVWIEGVTVRTERTPAAVPQDVTPGFLSAAGMRLIAGRDFTAHDHADAPLVAIVSRGFARAMWKDDHVLGRRFRLGARDSAWMSVVGVVDDIRARGHADTPEPTFYMPHAQTVRSSYYVSRSMALVVRTTGDPMGIVAAVRRVIAELDPAAPVSGVRTLEHIAGSAIANRRFSTALITGFAALALLLAGVGIFGVVSYSVSERTFELGVRMALGADRSRVMGLVVRDAALLAVTGVVIGFAGSAALGSGMRSLLVDVPRVDVATMSVVALVLMGVALIATLLPARRAASLQPTDVLRGG